MKENPCKNCDKRHATCHSTCKDYKQWKIEYDKAVKQMKMKQHIWF